MKKRAKLIVSIASICVALVALAIGIFASMTLTYQIKGSFAYNAEHAFITVEAKTYKYLKGTLTEQTAKEMLKTDRGSLEKIKEFDHSYSTYDDNGLMDQNITNKIFDNYDFEYKDAYAYFIVMRVWSIQEEGMVRAKITKNTNISNTWTFATEDIAIPVNNTGVEIVIGWGIEDIAKSSTGTMNYVVDFDVVEQFTPKQTGEIKASFVDKSNGNIVSVSQSFDQYSEIPKQTTTVPMVVNLSQMELYTSTNLVDKPVYTTFIIVEAGGFMVNNRLDISLGNIKYYAQDGTEITKPEAMFALKLDKAYSDVYEYESDASKETTGRFGLTYQPRVTSFALNVGENKVLSYGIMLPNEAATVYPQVYKTTFDIIVISEEQPVERSPFDYRIETDASGNVGVLAAPGKNEFSLESNAFDLVEMDSKVVNITVPLTKEFMESYMYSCLTLIPGDNVPAEAQGNALVWFQLVYLMRMSNSGYLPIVKSPVTYNVPGYGMHTFTPENWASDIQLLAALDTASQESFAANYFRATPSEGGTITIPVELYKLDSFPIYPVIQSFSLGLFFLVDFFTVNQSALIQYTAYQAAVKEGKIEPEQFGLTISSSYYDFLVKLLEGKINEDSFEGLELNDESRAFTNNVQYVPCIPGTRFMYAPAVQWVAPQEFDKVYINTTQLQKIYGINTKSYDSNLRAYTSKDGLLYSADESTIVAYPAAKPGAEFTILEGPTRLYDMSFAGTKNLTTLNFAKSITSFGANMFENSSIGVLNIFSENLDASTTALIDSINNSNIETVNILASRYMSDQEILQLQASCKAKINVSFINNVSKLIYDIREDGAYVVGMEDKTYEYMVIAESVIIGEETYTIVGIDANVFAECSNLIGLKLPHTLKTIGANNFGTLTKLTRLDLGVAEITSFGTGNTHSNLQIWAKNETTYTNIIATDSNAIGVDWQFLVDGGDGGSFDYQLTIGTTVYRVSGSSLANQGNQYNTHLIVFPQTSDPVVVSLVTNFTGFVSDNCYFDGIQEQVSLALKGTGDEYTKILGSETGAAGYVQFSQTTVSSSFPVLGADPVTVNPGSQLRLRIYYTVLQHVKCFTKDTEVTLADGTIKMIQDIGFDDLLLTYDFDRGEFSASYPVWIATPDTYDHYYKLSFDDGSTLEVVLAHRLFAEGSAGWEYLKSIDADYSCIGKKFLRQIMVDGVPTLTETTCTNIERINEECTYYNLVTSQALNFMSNGYIGATGIANMYTFEKVDDQTYVHNQEQLEFTKNGTTDDETGTMFAYERFNTEIIPYYIYVSYRIGEIRNMVNILKNVPPYNQLPLAQVEAIAIGLVNNYFKDGYMENIEKMPDTLKVSFSDREYNTRYEAGSMLELPTPNNATNFVGWYNTYDGKLYQPGDSAEIVINTHFIARYAA